MTDINEDMPHLSAETFAVLQEFYKEQELRELQTSTADKEPNLTFTEDWQLSQFWYNSDTIKSLTNVVINASGTNAKIALISCPSLYKSIKEQLRLKGEGEVHLYEYDTRFSIFGSDFIPYDYKSPEVSKDKLKYYDIVVADPPFLSSECLENIAITIKFLAKEKIVLCTGKVMSKLANDLLNLTPTSFQPQHENNLANEFACFTNFPIDSS